MFVQSNQYNYIYSLLATLPPDNPPKIYLKIRYFKKYFPKLPIQIDGGVKIFNAGKLKQAGATRLISGSGFFGIKDLKQRVQEFKDA